MDINMPGQTVMQNELYGNRSFQDLSSAMSGRSVVIQEGKSSSRRDMDSDMWPCSLSDYMKDYIGKMVIIEYVFNNTSYRRKGKLKVVGTNFVGMHTLQNSGLLLLELSTVKSINIID